MPSFDHRALQLHYSDRGDPGGPPIVLIHGLLWSSHMFGRLAELMPEHRVLLLDLRGHGTSTRPREQEAYSWSALASDVVALLDHLGIDRAVVGGLSLGANVTLATANEHPGRVSGMVVEMPVLDRAETAARTIFGTLARSLEVAAPVLEPASRLLRSVPAPRAIPELAALRDVLGADPRAGAALVRGLLDDSLLFDDLHFDVLTMPALVIGHGGDPIHVLDDARDLAERLLDAELIERRSILDYRVRPDLLAKELIRFVR